MKRIWLLYLALKSMHKSQEHKVKLQNSFWGEKAITHNVESHKFFSITVSSSSCLDVHPECFTFPEHTLTRWKMDGDRINGWEQKKSIRKTEQ